MLRLPNFKDSVLTLFIAYSIAVTCALVWQVYENYLLQTQVPTGPLTVAEQLVDQRMTYPDTELRWETIFDPDAITSVVGPPTKINANGAYWQSRCGTFQFYFANGNGPIRVQAQLPSRLVAN